MFGAAYTSHHPGQLQILFITSSMEESPFLKADSFSASQKIFHNWCNVKVHLQSLLLHCAFCRITLISSLVGVIIKVIYLQCSKELPLVHILIHIDPVHILPSYLFMISCNLYSHLCLGLPSDLVLRDFPPEMCMHFTTPPFVLHTPPISSSFTWSYK